MRRYVVVLDILEINGLVRRAAVQVGTARAQHRLFLSTAPDVVVLLLRRELDQAELMSSIDSGFSASP